MSTGSMSAGNAEMFEQFHGGRRMICGVCAWAGMHTGVPVWVVRVLAVLLLMTHGPLALLVYFGSAVWLKLSQGGRQTVRFTTQGWRNGPWNQGGWSQAGGVPPSGPAPFSGGTAADWNHAGLVDRFARLDRRLAQMEAEAMDGEFQLRQGFRDLEKR